MSEEIAIVPGEAAAISRGMVDNYRRDLNYTLSYTKQTFDEAHASMKRRRERDAPTMEEIEAKPDDALEWLDLEVAESHSPGASMALWNRAKVAAKEDLASGYAGSMPVTNNRESLQRVAQYIALRESLGNDWKPQGGMEDLLLDQLAQTHMAYTTWLRISMARASKEFDEPNELTRHYQLPTVTDEQAQAHAQLMADRYHRMFGRTLRQLQNMRRYAPVIVQNAEQINVAAMQQVNFTNSQDIGNGQTG